VITLGELTSRKRTSVIITNLDKNEENVNCEENEDIKNMGERRIIKQLKTCI
jgi:hypothetical protein